MNDEHDDDQEPTQPIAAEGGAEPAPPPVSPWAPPAPGTAPLPQEPSRPEPTAVLASDSLGELRTEPQAGPPEAPPMAPSLLPPAPPAPPTTADLSVRRPQPGSSAGLRWPLVALIALLVGLGGGFLGALAYDQVSDDGGVQGPGYATGGLSDVDLEDVAPLDAPGSVADVAKVILPSTVQILAEYDGQDAGATGSGWVMDSNGHIVTNNHVVADAAKNSGPIVVVDHQRNRYDAEVVGRSPVYDLAILFVQDFDGLKPATMGYSAKLQVGEPVVAVGSPLGLHDTVTSGIVSYLHRPVTTGRTADDSSYIDAVQTDAAINPGNSGGPLVNQKGEVVGVNSAIATAGGGGSTDRDAGNIGVGFAIPVEQVRITADQILKSGKAQYPVIGAKVKTGGIPTGEGAELDEIIAKSPAEAAGLRKGDIITHVNGVRVTDGIGLIVAIRTYQPGQTIEFTVERGKDEQKVEVTLDGEDG
ncbi:putative serine protease PepD [Nocardioides sp. J9]|uniref:S1C family serine protease n=1 Tax=unclassified Nocardioides TaxID=2615069 RepID=UPI0004B787C8|nr:MULTISPECIES: trypsin-like peptidase domain-containing protein [unclassified Nocardioides]TWG94144.1 putative serine protease PepD [Nocardioides sp. J9]